MCVLRAHPACAAVHLAWRTHALHCKAKQHRRTVTHRQTCQLLLTRTTLLFVCACLLFQLPSLAGGSGSTGSGEHSCVPRAFGLLGVMMDVQLLMWPCLHACSRDAVGDITEAVVGSNSVPQPGTCLWLLRLHDQLAHPLCLACSAWPQPNTVIS